MRALAGVETMGPNGRPFTPSLRDIERKAGPQGIVAGGGPPFLKVFIDTPLAVCEACNPKGLPV